MTLWRAYTLWNFNKYEKQIFKILLSNQGLIITLLPRKSCENGRRAFSRKQNRLQNPLLLGVYYQGVTKDDCACTALPQISYCLCKTSACTVHACQFRIVYNHLSASLRAQSCIVKLWICLHMEICLHGKSPVLHVCMPMHMDVSSRYFK